MWSSPCITCALGIKKKKTRGSRGLAGIPDHATTNGRVKPYIDPLLTLAYEIEQKLTQHTLSPLPNLWEATPYRVIETMKQLLEHVQMNSHKT
jgi:ankyrin repeat protein